MFDFWYFELVPPSVCSGVLPPLPLVSAFSGKQPRGSSFDRLVPNLPPADFCACHDVHRAETSRVSRRASTSTGVLRACVFSICRTFCKLHWELNSLPVVPTVYTCTDDEVHRAGTSSLCCTCACHGVHRAPRKSIPSDVSSNRSFRPRNWVKVTLLRSLQTQFLSRTIVWSIWTHVSCSAQTALYG